MDPHLIYSTTPAGYYLVTVSSTRKKDCTSSLKEPFHLISVHTWNQSIWAVIWLIPWPCYIVTAWNRPIFHLQSSWSTKLVSQSTTICRAYTGTQNFIVIDIYVFNSQETQSIICLVSVINQPNIYWTTWLWSQHCLMQLGHLGCSL